MSTLFPSLERASLFSLYRRLSWQMVLDFEIPIVRGFFRRMERRFGKKKTTRNVEDQLRWARSRYDKKIFLPRFARLFNVRIRNVRPSAATYPDDHSLLPSRHSIHTHPRAKKPPIHSAGHVFRNSRAFFTRKGRVNFQ